MPPPELEKTSKPTRTKKAKPPSTEDLQRQNQTLTALLSHFAPDVDPGAEKDRIAFYEDGTPVYVPPREDVEDGEDEDDVGDADGSDDEEEEGEEEEEEEEPVMAKKATKPKPLVPRLRKPAEQRRNTARQRPDVTAMITEARRTNAGL